MYVVSVVLLPLSLASDLTGLCVCVVSVVVLPLSLASDLTGLYVCVADAVFESVAQVLLSRSRGLQSRFEQFMLKDGAEVSMSPTCTAACNRHVATCKASPHTL